MTAHPAALDQRKAIRRNRRILLVVSLLLLTGVVGYWFVGWPKFGPSTVTNQSRAVSLNVPAGWTATTPWNARQIAWPLVGGPYRVEDIHMTKGASGSETRITIYLDVAPKDVELPELHARDLGPELKKKAVAVTSPVRDPEALASRSKRSENIVEVVTIRSQMYVVTAVVTAQGEASVEAANQALATLTVRDDT